MRRPLFNYKEFDKKIEVKDVDDEFISITYYNIHGRLTKEVIKKAEQENKLAMIEKERKEFKQLVDKKIIWPINPRKKDS